MTEINYTVLSTEIIATEPEVFTVEQITRPIMARPYRSWFKVKLAVLVDDGIEPAVYEYETEIPHVEITRRRPTHAEFVLAMDLQEVERRHQERLERWPR